MRKFFDQRFYVDFTFTATKASSSDPYSNDTPAIVRMPGTRWESLQSVYYLRDFNIENAFSGNVITYKSRIDTEANYRYYCIWSPSGQPPMESPIFSGRYSQQQIPSNSSFQLKAGNLNLPLTDEVISLIEDTNKPKFTRVINVEKEEDVVYLQRFTRVISGRKIIRRTYNINNILTKEIESRLYMSTVDLIPIPMLLTVERPTAGANTVNFTYTPARNIIEINSTGEEGGRWV